MRLVQHIKKASPTITRSHIRGGSVVSSHCGEVTPFPGNPDVAVSHGVFHMSGSTGFGKQASKKRLAQLRMLGYSAVICTVCADNGKQLTILRDGGWHESPAFTSCRTGHKILFFMKEL